MKLISTLVSLLLVGLSFGQANLPTNYSFDQVNLPTGWTTFLSVNPGDETYSTGSDATPSCKLDGDGEFVRVNFIEEPGDLSYYLRGTGLSQASANGTVFLVQESANGGSWNTLRTFDENNSTNTFTQYTDALAPTTKWVRFYYQDKVSGSNIAIDEISISEAPPGPEAKISIEYNGNQVNNGDEVFIGNQPNSTFEVFNEGLVNTLNISGAVFSGSESADFSTTGMPSSIAPTSSDNFDINFTPSLSGYHSVTLTISSDDPDQSTFVFNIKSLGSSLAPEPIEQPTNLNFVDINTYKFKVTYTAPANAPESYLVLKQNSSILNTPLDGESYQVGDYIGGAQVAYVGSDLYLIPSYIRGNQDYFFKVFSFNGYDGYENYLTSSALSGFFHTPYDEVGTYYDGLDWNSQSFVSDLTSRINPHNQIYYSEYIETLIENFEFRDTTNGQKVVTCSYSGYQHIYDVPFVWDVLSREHVFAHSWFPTSPAENNIEYSDLHNLFPVQLNNANIVRSNNPFGEVVNVTQSFLFGKLGQDANGTTVYEPKEDKKGDVARAIFYMCTAYNGVGGTWTLPIDQSQQLLKTWHDQDPPDNYERTRNDYIQSVQNNRNPFVDNPEYVCKIDFTNMTYIENSANCIYNTVTENEGTDINVYPNPSNERIFIEGTNEIKSIVLFDLTGKKVFSKELNKQVNTQLDIVNLKNGVYLLEVNTDSKTWRTTIIKQ